jgi:hypothetical protein
MTSIAARIVLAIGALVVLIENAAACPECKDSFSGGQNASVGEAYSWSILFMLGVTITIISVAIVVIARRLRQHPNSLST